MSFVCQSLPGKVIFANGAITQARTEAAALGMQRVLVLSTLSKRVLAERVAAAHCVEGLYAQNCNPITSLMAEAAIRALAANLPHAETHAVILPHVVAYNRLQAGDLDQVAELATRNPYYNPRPVERTGVRTLLQAAFDGIRPASL